MVFNLAAFAKNYAETNRQHPEPVPRGGGGVYTPERANYGTPDRGSYYSPMSEGGRGARNSWNRYQNTDKRQQSVVVPRERRNLRLDDASGTTPILDDKAVDLELFLGLTENCCPNQKKVLNYFCVKNSNVKSSLPSILKLELTLLLLYHS